MNEETEFGPGCRAGVRRPPEPAGDPLFELTPARACRCGRSHVELSGEVDLSGVDGLTSALEWLRMEGHRVVVVDVSRLRFLSATGLGVLARAARAYAEAGGSLTLARPTPTITRLLGVTGLRGLLVVDPDGRCGGLGTVDHTAGRAVNDTAGRAADFAAGRAVNHAAGWAADLAAGLGAGAADHAAGGDEAAVIRICAVLAGVMFPAMRWQLLAQADYYGADHRSRLELADLPDGRYADIASVQRALCQARRHRGGSPGR